MNIVDYCKCWFADNIPITEIATKTACHAPKPFRALRPCFSQALGAVLILTSTHFKLRFLPYAVIQILIVNISSAQFFALNVFAVFACSTVSSVIPLIGVSEGRQA